LEEAQTLDPPCCRDPIRAPHPYIHESQRVAQGVQRKTPQAVHMLTHSSKGPQVAHDVRGEAEAHTRDAHDDAVHAHEEEVHNHEVRDDEVHVHDEVHDEDYAGPLEVVHGNVAQTPCPHSHSHC